MTTTPESIAARYADLMCPSGAEPQSLTTMRKAFDDAIREALAPVEAERDAARAELAARAATDAAGALGRKP